MAWGLLSTGFVRKTLTEVTDSIVGRLRTAFGSAVKTVAQSVFGQLIAILGAEFDEAWEVLEEVEASGWASRAVGAALDALAEYTGTTRKGSSASTGTLLLVGDNATVVALGKRAQNPAGDLVAETTAQATLAGAPAWAPSTAYAVGAIVTSVGRIYYCAKAGTSGITAVVTNGAFPSTNLDGGGFDGPWWYFVGDGTAYALVAAKLTVVGKVPVSTWQLNAINTPVTGWRGVANPNDFVTGRNVETDDELRIRRAIEIHGLGKATLQSIQAALSALPLVTDVRLFENSTDVTDADGLPPHSFEAMVSGTALAADIAKTIFETKPAGIATHGTVSTVVADSKGNNHTIKHSTPANVRVYLEATLYVQLGVWPGATAATLAKTTLDARADLLVAGQDVRPGWFVDALFDALETQGLMDAVVKVDDAPITGATPVAKVPISIRQKGNVDSLDISVVVIEETP
jgi:uncharacterized phage protein gp47/JayE